MVYLAMGIGLLMFLGVAYLALDTVRKSKQMIPK